MSRPVTPFCANDQMWMRCTRTGREVEIVTPDGAPPAVVRGDEYECVDCGATVVVNFGEIRRDTATDGYLAEMPPPGDVTGWPV